MTPAHQSIDTAPMDGSRVLVWGDARISGYTLAPNEPAERDWYPARWIDGGWQDDQGDAVLAATHWAPLPGKPETEK